jgi:cytochrome c-type biogenesis protein CcmH/NrfF
VDEYHLSWGAHLLLWVFPVVLTAAAVFFHLRGRREQGDA